MYRTLTAADPKAEWMQMTWMFYHDRKDWTAPRIKALLTGVPKDKMYLLDYHCENVELWKTTDHFHGQPYIWCYLGNFGGNTTLTGNVKESGKRLENALLDGGSNLHGIGSTLEGLDVMQFPYEYIFEKAWNLNRDDDAWLHALADRHAGTVSQPVREAWDILFNDVYVQVPRTLGILPGYRPEMDKPNKRITNDYSDTVLLKAWDKLLQAPDCNRDALRLDIIAVGRQLLGNYFKTLKEDFDRMYAAKDVPGLKARASEMREVLSDLDKLTAFHSRCSLDKWIADARALGDTPDLKDYYEKNARNLITTWGGSLNDYASRAWSGLIKDYYSKRWDMYLDAVLLATESNCPFDQKELDASVKAFEDAWVDSTTPVTVQSEGDLMTYARFLLKKYERRIH